MPPTMERRRIKWVHLNSPADNKRARNIVDQADEEYRPHDETNPRADVPGYDQYHPRRNADDRASHDRGKRSDCRDDSPKNGVRDAKNGETYSDKCALQKRSGKCPLNDR